VEAKYFCSLTKNRFDVTKAAPFFMASLFTFMVMEVVLQAIMQINSVDYRAEKKHPNVNRRLRRILFTIPTATPLVEKQKYERRCQDAIALLWEPMVRVGLRRLGEWLRARETKVPDPF